MHLRLLHLAAVTTLLSLAVPGDAHAWGAAFEDAVLRRAVTTSGRPALVELLEEEALWSAPAVLPKNPAASPADVAQASYQDLVDHLRAADAVGAAEALRSLAKHTANVWQPMHAAAVHDPPGTAPGFHFRYEVLLARRAAHPQGLSHPLPPTDLGSLLRTHTANAAGHLADLAATEEVALAASGGRYDQVYYDALWSREAAHLEGAARQASQTLLDAIEAAWIEAGRPGEVGAPERPALVRAVGPNPATDFLEVSLRLAQGGEVDFALYSVTGRAVQRLRRRHLAAGSHSVRLNGLGRGLVAGIYLLRVAAPEGAATARIVLLD